MSTFTEIGNKNSAKYNVCSVLSCAAEKKYSKMISKTQALDFLKREVVIDLQRSFT